jgi:tetratricopeptide (TPR) repeat protein
LPRIWKQGDWSALGLAIGAAALVNVALAATLLWSELLTQEVCRILWVAVSVVWIASAVAAWTGDRREIGRRPPDTTQDRYPEALNHYLKGNWFEAEHALRELLRGNPPDPDAGLLLATLLRHTGRFDEAARQLDRLEQSGGGEKWALEIGREREQLLAARSDRVSG